MTNNNLKKIYNTVDMTNIIHLKAKWISFAFLKGLCRQRSPEYDSNAQFHVKYFPPIENYVA